MKYFSWHIVCKCTRLTFTIGAIILIAASTATLVTSISVHTLSIWTKPDTDIITSLTLINICTWLQKWCPELDHVKVVPSHDYVPAHCDVVVLKMYPDPEVHAQVYEPRGAFTHIVMSGGQLWLPSEHSLKSVQYIQKPSINSARNCRK